MLVGRCSLKDMNMTMKLLVLFAVLMDLAFAGCSID